MHLSLGTSSTRFDDIKGDGFVSDDIEPSHDLSLDTYVRPGIWATFSPASIVADEFGLDCFMTICRFPQTDREDQ